MIISRKQIVFTSTDLNFSFGKGGSPQNVLQTLFALTNLIMRGNKYICDEMGPNLP